MFQNDPIITSLKLINAFLLTKSIVGEWTTFLIAKYDCKVTTIFSLLSPNSLTYESITQSLDNPS